MKCDGLSYQKYINKGLNIFFLFGPEVVLKNNAKDDIRVHLAAQGFVEKKIVKDKEIDRLDKVITESIGGSLFASKIIIEISHTKGKIPESIQSIADMDYVRSRDDIAIIIDSHVDKVGSSLKWFKKMEEIALIIESKKLKSFEEKIWLKQQLSFIDSSKRSDLVNKISALSSSNLVAQQNEIKLLKLMSSPENIYNNEPMKDQAEFMPFELEDRIIKGDVKGAIRIVSSIKELESHYAALLVWVVGKIINNAASAMQSSRPDAALIKLGVWNNKVGDYKALMSKFELKDMINFQKKVFQLDLSNKGINKANFWERLTDLIMELTRD
ncbi:DNA-directed DNA polymerase [Gammaproteobacteria bacterium]|nr:DNA-directed DNA polymerase [Gammaproteobacteria bacterium]